MRSIAPHAAKPPASRSPTPSAAPSGDTQLSRDSLAGLIDARRFDVSVKIMPDAAALDDYLANTAGALFTLASAAAWLAAPQPSHARWIEAVRAAGIAYGLTGLMRALSGSRDARDASIFRQETLLRHGTSPEQVLAGEASKGLTDVLAELRETARVALNRRGQHVAELPRAARKAFLPLALVDPYLSALQKVDPLHQVAEINPLYRLWRLATCRFPQSA